MKRLIHYATVVLTIVACSSCKQPTEAVMSGGSALSTSASTSAHPVIAYTDMLSGSGYVWEVVWAADSTGANAAVVSSDTTNCYFPTWAPTTNTIAYVTSSTSSFGSSLQSIMAVDVSVSSGKPVGSNTRVLDTGMSKMTSDIAWSSTSSVDKIAYGLQDSSYAYLCRTSGSGYNRDTLYTFSSYTYNGKTRAPKIKSVSWSPDDSKIAVFVWTNPTQYIAIISTSNGTMTDSIYWDAGSSNQIDMYAGIDWSRTSNTNSLLVPAIVGGSASSQSLDSIYYLTPSSGSSKQTSGLGLTHAATWSPSDGNVLYGFEKAKSGTNYYEQLQKVTVFKTKSSLLVSNWGVNEPYFHPCHLRWHR